MFGSKRRAAEREATERQFVEEQTKRSMRQRHLWAAKDAEKEADRWGEIARRDAVGGSRAGAEFARKQRAQHLAEARAHQSAADTVSQQLRMP